MPAKPEPLPKAAAVANDEYSLPKTDACYGVVEGYKHYVADQLDAYFHTVHSQEFSSRLEQWQNCCPELREEIEHIRSPFPDLEQLSRFQIPASVLAPGSACAQHPFFRPAGGNRAPAKAWQIDQERHSQVFWIKRYHYSCDSG